jgi:hypothetical protein
VISNFFQCTIIVTTSAKSFFQQNFNLQWTRSQRGQESLMLFLLLSKVWWPTFKECYVHSIKQFACKKNKIKNALELPTLESLPSLEKRDIINYRKNAYFWTF